MPTTNNTTSSRSRDRDRWSSSDHARSDGVGGRKPPASRRFHAEAAADSVARSGPEAVHDGHFARQLPFRTKLEMLRSPQNGHRDRLTIAETPVSGGEQRTARRRARRALAPVAMTRDACSHGRDALEVGLHSSLALQLFLVRLRRRHVPSAPIAARLQSCRVHVTHDGTRRARRGPVSGRRRRKGRSRGRQSDTSRIRRPRADTSARRPPRVGSAEGQLRGPWI